MKVQNSVAFITGANRGLGLAFAQDLVRRGPRRSTLACEIPTASPYQE
jgi:NAD(P)-dependent dehydrogenase (short-subunit alcohol dehydrogenase family)